MQPRLSIGDFSRMTYLSVKALRHYHEVGLLEPAEVDATNGYRYYGPDQVGPAQMIRRLRDLGMPLDDVRTIVEAPDSADRDRALVDHLKRMEHQLAETQQTVASLRTLLEPPTEAAAVERRDLSATLALAITDHVGGSGAVAWWMDAFTHLHRTQRVLQAERVGADGALFAPEFFEDGEGMVTAFLPIAEVPGGVQLPARVRATTVPAARVAVLVHDGPFGDLDRTYGALGTWVYEHAVSAGGPVREYYFPLGDPDDLLAHRTEVCWPVQ
jgi:DNA-binding transcriptional MerR regulator